MWYRKKKSTHIFMALKYYYIDPYIVNFYFYKWQKRIMIDSYLFYYTWNEILCFELIEWNCEVWKKFQLKEL